MKKWLLPALVLALIGASTPAMAVTIYFASSEDTGFTLTGSARGCGFGGGCEAGNSNFSAAGLQMENSGTSDPPANRAVTPPFTASSHIWIHGEASFGNSSCTANQQALIARSPDGVGRILLLQTATCGELKISTRNAAGTITDLVTASSAVSTGTYHQLDFEINYSTSGWVNLYMDGALVATYSGDVTTNGATQLDQADFAAVATAATVSDGWSQIIIADSDTRSMALKTLAPQAAGSTQSWTPNTVADISKSVINDATAINTTSANALSEWTVPTTLPSGAWNVLAIVQEARAEGATSGPQHLEWLLRSGGTDNVTGTLAPPTASFGNFGNQIWAVNPTSGSAWSTGDITGGGLQLGIESLN